MRYLRVIIPSLFLYLALTGNFAWGNILLGLLVALLVALLVQPGDGLADPSNLPAALVALLRYVLVLAYDLIVSGVQVARIVLDPRLPIRPGIVAIPTDCQSELGRALSAHAISLTPGELVVEVGEDGTMYTHCLDASQATDLVANVQKMREAMLTKILA